MLQLFSEGVIFVGLVIVVAFISGIQITIIVAALLIAVLPVSYTHLTGTGADNYNCVSFLRRGHGQVEK